jgi:phage baseplate assembly protein W
MANYTFTGFSTISGDAGGAYVLHDLDLVNQDLYIAFNTMLGERVMRPTEGCAIWNYLDEQFTSVIQEEIVAEAIRICQLDTRLQVNDVTVTTQDNGISVEILLTYVPWNVVGTFTTTFNNQESALWTDSGEQS